MFWWEGWGPNVGYGTQHGYKRDYRKSEGDSADK